MSKIKKIAIFSHAATDHVNWVLGLREGFRKLGIEVVTSWPHPTEGALQAILENFQPDVVFEINRSRHQSNIPDNIFHVSFIQDHRAYGVDVLSNFGGSQLYYSIIPPKGYGFSDEVDAQTKVFFPGANTFRYYDPKIEQRYDWGLFGFIANPNYLSKSSLQKYIITTHPRLGRFIDLIRAINLNHKTLTFSSCITDIKRGIELYFQQRNCADLLEQSPNILEQMESFVTMKFARAMSRVHTVNKMLEVSTSCGLWGHINWTEYPRFKPFYKGFLSGVPSLSAGLQSMTINIHSTGSNVHPRIVNGMALRVPTAIFRVEEDSKRFGIHQFFEPDVDYIDVTFDNCVDKLREALKYPNKLAEMSDRAFYKVKNTFTWEYRCQMILKDIRDRM